MLNDAVVAMLVVHVDDVKIAATKEVTDSVVADINKRFPTKHLGGVTWHTGSEYRRDREKETLETWQTQFIRNVVDRFGIIKTSPTPHPTPPHPSPSTPPTIPTTSTQPPTWP